MTDWIDELVDHQLNKTQVEIDESVFVGPMFDIMEDNPAAAARWDGSWGGVGYHNTYSPDTSDAVDYGPTRAFQKVMGVIPCDMVPLDGSSSG